MSDSHLAESRVFEMRPNRSLSREGMVVCLVAIGFLTLLVTVRFVLLGAWLVMPFAILELVGVASAFYVVERRTRYRETISVASDCLRFQALSGVKVVKEYDFHPYWVQVVLHLSPNDWYPSRLLLKSHGRSIEVGTFLTDEDRATLAAEIRSSLAHYQRKN